MNTLHKLIVLLVNLLCLIDVQGQIIHSKNDSIDFYKKIEDYSKRSELTEKMHKLVFKSRKPKKNSDQTPNDTKPYPAEGKIIRNINIITLDPFGSSSTDTIRKPKNWGERTGNHLHLKTKSFAIKNLLLFKKNTPFNTLKIKETERLIRAQRFSNFVAISNQIIGNDSVDVTVREIDSWTLIPRFSISSSKTRMGFDERNIFGTGHQLEYKFIHSFESGNNGNDASYIIPNIKNSFITTQLFYNNDLENFYNKGIQIERPFYSPLAKWAAGITVEQHYRKDSLQGPDQNYSLQNFKHSIYDFWYGHAFPVFKHNVDQTTNLILSGRILTINYQEQPELIYDPKHFFSDEKQFLVGIGINTRQFLKDRYLFSYGRTEDVPVGRTFSITSGYQHKNNIWKPYFGGQISHGNYFTLGFWSAHFEAGTYFYKGKTYQTAFDFEFNYFTNLLEWGDWKFRQFIKPQLVIGINREDSIGDLISLNQTEGLPPFDESIHGRSKMLVTLQTQSYVPKEIWGFRLNPYFNYTLGILSNEKLSITKSPTFSRISLGILINNDYLVFSSFQLSFSYYPSIPYDGGKNLKTNAFETRDFGFQSFELNKPHTVKYN